MVTKPCTKCGETKELGGFSKSAKGKFGRKSECKACTSAAEKAYNAKYPAKRRLRGKSYRAKDPEKYRARVKAYRNAHPEQQANTSREWYKKNLERHKVNAKRWRASHESEVAAAAVAWLLANLEHAKAKAKLWRAANKLKRQLTKQARRARELQANPQWANANAIAEIYRQAALMTKLTGTQYHVDHIVPLRSKLVCGLHVEFNLRVTTATENFSKNNRYWPDMPEVPTHLATVLADLSLEACVA